MRDIRAEHIGTYVTFKGLCTRVGDVKPMIEVAHYTCEGCRDITTQELRIQEMSEDVPVGRIPRSITAQIKGDLTRILRFSFASL
ncbi:unnamed protein product [Bathycoccus prasinos]